MISAATAGLDLRFSGSAPTGGADGTIALIGFEESDRAAGADGRRLARSAWRALTGFPIVFTHSLAGDVAERLKAAVC